MKRILLLTTVFMMMLGTSFSSAQTDADNFYKSDLVSVEKVSFSNQYKMKVARNTLQSLSDIQWELSRNRARIFTQRKWPNGGL